MQKWLENKLFIIEEVCRWKLSWIVEQNAGLHASYDKDVKIAHALVSNYARNKELRNKYSRLTFFVINVYYPVKWMLICF